MRTANSLKADQLIYIGELAQRTPAELLRMRNLGRKGLGEIEKAFAEKGLHLSMDDSGISPIANTANSSELDQAIQKEEARIAESQQTIARLVWLRDKAPELKKDILALIEKAGIEINHPHIKGDVDRLISTLATIKANPLVP